MRECLRKSRFCAGDTQKAYDRVLIWQWKISVTIGKAVTLRCSVKKTVSKNPGKFTRKHLFQAYDTLAQAFSFEFCGIFKNTFLIEHFQWLILRL